MKKAVYAMLLALLLLLSACSVVSSGRSGKFEKQVRNNQYGDALETWDSSIAGDSSREVAAADFLKEYLEDSWKKYMDETLSRSDFDAILKTVQRIDDKLGVLGWTIREITADYSEVYSSKEAFQTGVKELESRNYESAMEALSRVEPVDEKNYREAQDKLAEARNLYVEGILSSAREAAEARNYDGALELLRTAERTIGQDSRFDDLRGTVVTADFESKMRVASETGDFSRMNSIYQSALRDEECRISAEMTNLYSEQQQRFIQDIVDRSIASYKSSGYAEAIPVISEGLAVLPEDTALNYYYDLYVSCIPADLNSLSILNKNGYYYTEQSPVTDPFGKEHTGSSFRFCMDYFTNTVSVDYVLDSRYSTLAANYFVKKYRAQLCIYADGVKVFDSDVFDKNNGTMPISISVENVRILRVETTSHSEISVFGDIDTCNVYLVDIKLVRLLSDKELEE